MFLYFFNISSLSSKNEKISSQEYGTGNGINGLVINVLYVKFYFFMRVNFDFQNEYMICICEVEKYITTIFLTTCVCVIRREATSAHYFSGWTEVGIYKRNKKTRFRTRKRSRKKERKHALDQESNQEKNFLLYLIVFLVKNVFLSFFVTFFLL